ncbi:MAG: hypothetical protein F4018_01295 [Acidobacteria bacterium]|nr:hypothetical protein [Acidobacteriota bacterium]MYK87082.1 hypothetical protein [Acidobacteriota bacterium]
MRTETVVPEILAATLMTIPIAAGAACLLRRYPHQTAVMATEGLLYCVPVYGYLALMLTLADAGSPVGLKVLSMGSWLTVALGTLPLTVRRVARRLKTAEDADRRKREGDRAG